MDLSSLGTLAGSALVFGSPAYMAWWRWQVARHWTLVEGVVVRMELAEGSAGEVDGVRSPVIRARRPDGEAVQFKSVFGSDPSPWREGDDVSVRMRGDVVQHDAPWHALWYYGGEMMIGFIVIAAARGHVSWDG